MNTKKSKQHELIITEIVAWIFVVAILYIFVKMTF